MKKINNSNINDIIEVLSKCKLCKNMSNNQIIELLENGNNINTYKKGEFIFCEGDMPKNIFILLKGKVDIGKDTLSGRRIIITNIQDITDIFGEIYIFIEKKEYDVYAQAMEDSTVLAISNDVFSKNKKAKSEVDEILQYNLMCIFAAKAYLMKSKIKILGSSSVREKIVRFLFERQGEDGVVRGNLKREDMADYINVTRPSLSRELSNMQKDGIIKIEGNNIIIKDQKEFESYI